LRRPLLRLPTLDVQVLEQALAPLLTTREQALPGYETAARPRIR